MFSNVRSYLSRFSRFILFAVAVFVVGLLLVLTISSADDNNDSSSNVSNDSGTSQTEGTSSSNLTYDQPVTDGEGFGPTVSVESSSSPSTSYNTSDPQTLETTEVSLDSQDSVTITTNTYDENGRVDASGSATDTAVLPNTGPLSIITTVIALVIMTSGIAYWMKSRQNLTHQLLISNR